MQMLRRNPISCAHSGSHFQLTLPRACSKICGILDGDGTTPRWRSRRAARGHSGAARLSPYRFSGVTSVHQRNACGGCQSVPCSSHKIDEVLCILQASGCVGSGVVPAVCTFCFSRCGLHLRLLHVVARCFRHLAVGLHWHDWCPLTRLVLAASTWKLPRS